MIKTARTTIRPFVSSDLNDLQQILGDPVTMTYVEPPYTYEQTKHFLENFCIKRKAVKNQVRIPTFITRFPHFYQGEIPTFITASQPQSILVVLSSCHLPICGRILSH